MIHLEDVQVVIDEPRLGPLSLTIATGEHVVVIGPSGAGKSLLVECIAGVRIPSSGVVRFDGREVTHSTAWQRGCGWVPQSRALFPHLTVRQNIGYGGPEARSRVDALASRLGITQVLEKSPLVLSGGERSRVALARALATAPRFLVLDEPFTALDVATRALAWELVRQTHAETGITLVHVTHDVAEAQAAGLRMIGIIDGQLAEAP